MQTFCASREGVTDQGNNKEMQNDLQQQIIRSLLGCCLIKDQPNLLACANRML